MHNNRASNVVFFFFFFFFFFCCHGTTTGGRKNGSRRSRKSCRRRPFSAHIICRASTRAAFAAACVSAEIQMFSARWAHIFFALSVAGLFAGAWVGFFSRGIYLLLAVSLFAETNWVGSAREREDGREFEKFKSGVIGGFAV